MLVYAAMCILNIIGYYWMNNQYGKQQSKLPEQFILPRPGQDPSMGGCPDVGGPNTDDERLDAVIV